MIRELTFENPFGEDTTKKLINNSMNELDFFGHWEFKFTYNKVIDSGIYVSCEKVMGFIVNKDSDIIADFQIYAPVESYDHPMFQGIRFNPPLESKSGMKRYKDNIDKIYKTFEKNYEKILRQIIKKY
jgi:hypothetical protein